MKLFVAAKDKKVLVVFPQYEIEDLNVSTSVSSLIYMTDRCLLLMASHNDSNRILIIYTQVHDINKLLHNHDLWIFFHQGLNQFLFTRIIVPIE